MNREAAMERKNPSAPRANERQQQPGGGKPADDTLQSRKDDAEKRKHPASENELKTTQDKNPVPPDTTRESTGKSTGESTLK
ncbi:MAG TPA: hypothetical protein VNE00_00890 [Paraburkholderia sp.]|jgi:hypothetical protein|nr:hypothetical protein [Paraburkholderia sp.]